MAPFEGIVKEKITTTIELLSNISTLKKGIGICLFLTLAATVVFYNLPSLTSNGLGPRRGSRRMPAVTTQRIMQELAKYQQATPDQVKRRMEIAGKFNVKSPPSFEKDWKNFCWHHTYPSGRRKFLCLPYFYIAGFRKCGTTDLFYRLGLHPEVSLPWRKETLWWTFHRRWIISIYADLYGAKTFVKGEEQRNFFVMGDADPNIVVQNKMVKHDMVLSIGDIIKYYTPDAKFVILMRNPIDRLYSDYLYTQLGAWSPRDFHRRVKNTIEAYNKCFRIESMRRCIYNTDMKNKGANNRLPLAQGMYVFYVYDWLQVFSKKQVLFLKSEEMFKNAGVTYKKVLKFLELEAVGDEQISSITSMSEMNRNIEAFKSSGPMYNHTRDLLEDYYRSYNRALAKVMLMMVGILMLNVQEESGARIQRGAISVVKTRPANGRQFLKKRIMKELMDYRDPPENLVRSMAFNIKPPLNLMPEWKNFCWNQTTKGPKKFLCLPYFYIVGFRKCATTDIFEKINVHPQFHLPFRKETLWWSFHPMWSFSDYADIFGGVTFPRGKNSIMGDADPNVAFMHIRRNGHLVLKAHIMHMYTPGAKVIFMLRNPTERMYSDYLYMPRAAGARTAGDFNKRVLKGTLRYKMCFAQTSVRNCIYNRKNVLKDARNQVRLYQGMYVQFIYDWMQVFPRNQILVLRSEDLFKDGKTTTLKRVFDFLGVDELTEEELGAIIQLPQGNKNDVVKKTAGPMFKATRNMLDDIYRPFNEALAELLHDRRFLWEE